MVPFMNVPVVSTAARQRNVMPKKVDTPRTSSLGPMSRPTAMPCGMCAKRSAGVGRRGTALAGWGGVEEQGGRG
eukprot:355102-Chlamydomonas_euryale.AAC.3